MKKIAITASAVTLGALALTGCATERPADVVDPAANVVNTEPPLDPTTEDSSIVEDEPSPEPSETSTTVPVGTTVSVGSWDVTVTKVVKNAGSLIKNANQFNDPAQGRYVLVTYKATYRGDERKSDVGYDLTWSFTDQKQVTHDSASVVTPAEDKELPSEARKGGTVTHDVAFDVPASKISGGLITVEGYGDDFETVYADFTF